MASQLGPDGVLPDTSLNKSVEGDFSADLKVVSPILGENESVEGDFSAPKVVAPALGDSSLESVCQISGMKSQDLERFIREMSTMQEAVQDQIAVLDKLKTDGRLKSNEDTLAHEDQKKGLQDLSSELRIRKDFITHLLGWPKAHDKAVAGSKEAEFADQDERKPTSDDVDKSRYAQVLKDRLREVNAEQVTSRPQIIAPIHERVTAMRLDTAVENVDLEESCCAEDLMSNLGPLNDHVRQGSATLSPANRPDHEILEATRQPPRTIGNKSALNWKKGFLGLQKLSSSVDATSASTPELESRNPPAHTDDPPVALEIPMVEVENVTIGSRKKVTQKERRRRQMAAASRAKGKARREFTSLGQTHLPNASSEDLSQSSEEIEGEDPEHKTQDGAYGDDLVLLSKSDQAFLRHQVCNDIMLAMEAAPTPVRNDQAPFDHQSFGGVETLATAPTPVRTDLVSSDHQSFESGMGVELSETKYVRKDVEPTLIENTRPLQSCDKVNEDLESEPEGDLLHSSTIETFGSLLVNAGIREDVALTIKNELALANDALELPGWVVTDVLGGSFVIKKGLETKYGTRNAVQGRYHHPSSRRCVIPSGARAHPDKVPIPDSLLRVHEKVDLKQEDGIWALHVCREEWDPVPEGMEPFRVPTMAAVKARFCGGRVRYEFSDSDLPEAHRRLGEYIKNWRADLAKFEVRPHYGRNVKTNGVPILKDGEMDVEIDGESPPISLRGTEPRDPTAMNGSSAAIPDGSEESESIELEDSQNQGVCIEADPVRNMDGDVIAVVNRNVNGEIVSVDRIGEGYPRDEAWEGDWSEDDWSYEDHDTSVEEWVTHRMDQLDDYPTGGYDEEGDRVPLERRSGAYSDLYSHSDQEERITVYSYFDSEETMVPGSGDLSLSGVPDSFARYTPSMELDSNEDSEADSLGAPFEVPLRSSMGSLVIEDTAHPSLKE